VQLSILQYPKFPQSQAALKSAFVELLRQMMVSLSQCRLVVQFPDETLMLEQTVDIDPRINVHPTPKTSCVGNINGGYF